MLFTVFSRLIHYKRKKNISQNFNTTLNFSIPAINENLITNSMSKNENLRDLNWLTQAIETEAFNLNSVSFYLSQPNSNCHQETENSINVNISKENNFHFSLILLALGTSGKAKSTLENIGFHQVSWELEQIQNLGVLLENGENIKQILFQRNKFSPECLSVFSEIVKRNIILKDISFSESGIGSTGAGLIASALKVNNCLEDLQIWEDSIGLKGAEELSKMIEANPNLKLLTIFDSSSVIATPIISAVLARNRAMEVHIWSHGKGEKISKVVEFVPENNTLCIYKLDLAGSCRAVCALGWNTTVKTLDMTGIKLKSQWAKEFRWVLEQNRTLKEVNLSKTCLRNKGVVYVSAGLFKNKKLETLYLNGNWFSGVGVEHLLCPLSRFSSLQIQANTTLKSITFGGRKNKIGRDGLAAIVQMLTTNETLARLGIYNDESLRTEDIIKIFKSLEKNANLRFLSLQGCKGVKGEFVLQAIMETLQVNPWLEGLDLTRTPLETEGKTEEIYQKLGQNGNLEISIETETDLLKDMLMVVPKSCRVFFCGQEYAGKTTLCNTVSQNFSSLKIQYIEHVKTLVNPVEHASGMKIKIFKDEDTNISIWNLGRQHEFYSLHDFMFPGHGSASFFVIISSLFRKPSNREPKTPSEIEEDLQYWLRFIVSNSKKAVQQCMLSNIAIVLTHYDKITQNLPSENFQATVDLIQRLRDKFQGFIDIYPTIFTVDARSSASVSKLTHHIQKTSKTILERVPRVYQVCNDLLNIISDWRKENANKPTMRWNEFSELCQIRVPSLRIRSRNDNKKKVEMRRRAIANCLHHIGEVIYFDELGCIILDYEWFCGEVLGQLVKLEGKKQNLVENNGFTCRKDLEMILKGSLQSQIFDNLDPSDLVKMMLKLELCHKQVPEDLNSMLLIPSILEDCRGRPQRWQFNTPEYVYTGRHLECDDSSHVFLTPDFFPRLQVHLYNKIMGLKNQHGATYSLEKYLISINVNGIHVRVELGGQFGYYIDILACSAHNITETLRLIRQLIIPTIQSLCQNITLTESIIRPECVKNLTPPRYRKKQIVSLQNLKEALLSVPAESMYDYQHTWDSFSDSGKLILKSGFDLARDLLSDEDFREVLHRRYNDLYNLANELQVPPENEITHNDQVNNEHKIEPTFGGIAKGVEEVLQRLKIIEQEIRDLKQEIQGLRYYEHRLLIELHRKIDYLVNYNVQLEERKYPNMFYFVNTENFSRRLITNMISGMNATKLHMLCEYRQEMHVVDDQMGCEIMQIDNLAIKCLAPYMKKFMTILTFALKIGAHLAVGMGEMIPDLSREVARLVETSAIYGAGGAVAAGIVGAAAFGGRNRYMDTRDIQQDQKAAQQWVIDFLRDQNCLSGKDIADKFGLWRVRYRDSGQIAWICRRHMYTRANEIMEVPV